MNPIDLQRAKQIWPGLTDLEISLVLWSCTTFPVGDLDEVLAALKDAYTKSGGDLLQALHQADERITKSQTGQRGG